MPTYTHICNTLFKHNGQGLLVQDWSIYSTYNHLYTNIQLMAVVFDEPINYAIYKHAFMHTIIYYKKNSEF